MIADFLLNDCFWSFYDRGISPDKTPLLTGLVDETPLTDLVCARFGVTQKDAESEIMAARREVQL